jgi:hypothetical protein
MILCVRTMHYTINEDHNHPTQPSRHTHRDQPCCSTGHNRTAIPASPRSVSPAPRPQSQRKAPAGAGGPGPQARPWMGSMPAVGRSEGATGPELLLALATAPFPRRGAEATSQGQHPPAMAAPVLSTTPMPSPAASQPAPLRRELYMGAHLLLLNNYVAILVPTQIIALHYIGS